MAFILLAVKHNPASSCSLRQHTACNGQLADQHSIGSYLMQYAVQLPSTVREAVTTNALSCQIATTVIKPVAIRQSH